MITEQAGGHLFQIVEYDHLKRVTATLAEQMKTRIGIALLVFCGTVAAQTNVFDLATEIIGTWQAGETYMPQPPPEMQQDIKTITFGTNGIVTWSTVVDGTMKEMVGRYVISPNDLSARKLPSIFVAPTNYVNPGVSSICLLLLTDVTIDIDARFNPDKVGKAFKGNVGLMHEPKKKVVFVRKK